MAKSKKNYGLMQAASAHSSVAGISPNMPSSSGDKTPKNKRKLFAKALMKSKGKY